MAIDISFLIFKLDQEPSENRTNLISLKVENQSDSAAIVSPRDLEHIEGGYMNSRCNRA